MSTKAKEAEAAVAAPETVKEIQPDPEELVDYIAPMAGNPKENQPILVGVNGEFLRIQRGVPVKIKRKFLEVLQNAQAQEYEAYRNAMRAQEAAAKG